MTNRYIDGNPKFALVVSRGYVRLVRTGRQPSRRVVWPRIVRRGGVWMATDEPEEADPDGPDDIQQQLAVQQDVGLWADEPTGADDHIPDEELHPSRGPSPGSGTGRRTAR